MTAQNVELVKRSIAAYNRRDFEAMREMNHPDVEVDWSASIGLDARVYRGVDAVMGFYADYIETFDEIEIVPERFLESGDAVIVPNRARLRGRDGIETGARSALVFEVRDGLITRLRMYQGEDEALEALGVER